MGWKKMGINEHNKISQKMCKILDSVFLGFLQNMVSFSFPVVQNAIFIQKSNFIRRTYSSVSKEVKVKAAHYFSCHL